MNRPHALTWMYWDTVIVIEEDAMRLNPIRVFPNVGYKEGENEIRTSERN